MSSRAPNLICEKNRQSFHARRNLGSQNVQHALFRVAIYRRGAKSSLEFPKFWIFQKNTFFVIGKIFFWNWEKMWVPECPIMIDLFFESIWMMKKSWKKSVHFHFPLEFSYSFGLDPLLREFWIRGWHGNKTTFRFRHQL